MEVLGDAGEKRGGSTSSRVAVTCTGGWGQNEPDPPRSTSTCSWTTLPTLVYPVATVRATALTKETEGATRSCLHWMVAVVLATAACRSVESPAPSSTTSTASASLAAPPPAAVSDVVDETAFDASKSDVRQKGVAAAEATDQGPAASSGDDSSPVAKPTANRPHITPEVFSREMWQSVLSREGIRPDRALRPKPAFPEEDWQGACDCTPPSGFAKAFIPMNLEDTRLTVETLEDSGGLLRDASEPVVVLTMTRPGLRANRIAIREVELVEEPACPWNCLYHSVGQPLSCGKRSYLAIEFSDKPQGARNWLLPSVLVVSAPQEGKRGKPRVEGWVDTGFNFDARDEHVGVTGDVFLGADCRLRAVAVYRHERGVSYPDDLAALLANPRHWTRLIGNAAECDLAKVEAMHGRLVVDTPDDGSPWAERENEVFFASDGPWRKTGGIQEPVQPSCLDWRAVAQTAVVDGYQVEPGRTLQGVIGERAKRSCLWGSK